MADIGLTFGNTLRSILRQDPDVIMIGEIRDDETARIAVRASITGHLVLSTIHTNNSLNTIERLLDMEVERYLLGSALTGIISQRLVKRLCPKCRTSRPTTNYEKILFEKVLHQQVDNIYTPQGCSECINGYTGRVALHEVLIITQEIRDAITNNVRKNELRHLVYDRSDVTSLLKDGLEKVVAGLTSIDEILRVIDVDDDIGEDDEDLKAAFIGKAPTPEVIDAQVVDVIEPLDTLAEASLNDINPNLAIADNQSLNTLNEIPQAAPPIENIDTQMQSEQVQTLDSPVITPVEPLQPNASLNIETL